MNMSLRDDPTAHHLVTAVYHSGLAGRDRALGFDELSQKAIGCRNHARWRRSMAIADANLGLEGGIWYGTTPGGRGGFATLGKQLMVFAHHHRVLLGQHLQHVAHGTTAE